MKRSRLRNNKITQELTDINREISKIDDELRVAIDHRDFIMDLSKLMSAAVKKKKKKQNKESESDTDFFITKQQEEQLQQQEDEGDQEEG